MRRRVFAALVGAALSFGAVSVTATTPAGARPDRPAHTAAASGTAVAAQAAQAVPKDPVVIVGGFLTGQPIASLFYAVLATRLRADGYQAFIFGPVNFGLADIRDSAASLNTFVDGVRAQTGAAKVDLIGHSQGGLTSRYYVKSLGGAAEVDSLISLSSLHYGTLPANLGSFLLLGNCLGIAGCQQMSIGSSFLAELNAGDDTIGNVVYTNIVTRFDELIIPYTNGFLHDDGNNTNISVQSQCPLKLVEHVTVALDADVYGGMLDALKHQPISFDC